MQERPSPGCPLGVAGRLLQSGKGSSVHVRGFFLCAVGVADMVAGLSVEVEPFVGSVPLKPCALLLCRGV